ncbi:MAG: MFS transporter [Thermoplasmataceae archaeon]
MQDNGKYGQALNRRWFILPLLVLSVVEATFNWFNIVGTFGYIGPVFKIGVAQFGLLVGVFLAGYGIFHLPVGVFANRFGFRNMLLLGFVLESVGSILSGLAPDYPFLVAMRILSGVGASFVVGVSFALTNVWFKDAEINLANGLVGGVGFAIGAAIVLQYGATFAAALGWRNYLLMTGIVGLIIAGIVTSMMRMPSHEKRLAGGRITSKDLKEVFGNKALWFLGISILGAYGSYFTTSELISTYAGSGALHFSAGIAAATGTLVLLIGIPGSIVGGIFTDRVKKVKLVFGIFELLVGLFFFSILVDPNVTVWLLGAVVGFSALAAFAAFTAVPGIMGTVSAHNLALGAGLLLSMAAIGGFLVPTIFGIIAATSYTHAWIFLGSISLVFLVFLPLVREPFRIKSEHYGAQ